jgi:hypothetical protein
MRKLLFLLSIFSMNYVVAEAETNAGNPELDFVTVELNDGKDPSELTPGEQASLRQWVSEAEEDGEAKKEIPENSFVVSEIRENGRFIALENGALYKVPTALRKKVQSWNRGDILRVEPTMRSSWVRLTNVISNESVLAKVEKS